MNCSQHGFVRKHSAPVLTDVVVLLAQVRWAQFTSGRCDRSKGNGRTKSRLRENMQKERSKRVRTACCVLYPGLIGNVIVVVCMPPENNAPNVHQRTASKSRKVAAEDIPIFKDWNQCYQEPDDRGLTENERQESGRCLHVNPIQPYCTGYYSYTHARTS
jgi:hypothetical protein